MLKMFVARPHKLILTQYINILMLIYLIRIYFLFFYNDYVGNIYHARY